MKRRSSSASRPSLAASAWTVRTLPLCTLAMCVGAACTLGAGCSDDDTSGTTGTSATGTSSSSAGSSSSSGSGGSAPQALAVSWSQVFTVDTDTQSNVVTLRDLSIASNGDLVAAGIEFALVDDVAPGSDHDATLRRVGSDGSLLWSFARDCGSGCDDRGAALALDAAGDIYLAGSVDRARWLISKTDASGSEQLAGWNKSEQPEGVEGEIVDAAWVGDALVVVGSSGDHSLVRGFVADGAEASTWSKRIDAPSGAAALSEPRLVASVGGDALVLGIEKADAGAPLTSIWTEYFSAAGQSLGRHELYNPSVSSLSAVAVAGGGVPYALISTSDTPGMRLVELPSGTPIQSFDPAGSLAMGVAPSGDVLLAFEVDASDQVATVDVYRCNLEGCSQRRAELSRAPLTTAPNHFDVGVIAATSDTIYLGGGWSSDQWLAAVDWAGL
jgi:hypothetical protein